MRVLICLLNAILVLYRARFSARLRRMQVREQRVGPSTPPYPAPCVFRKTPDFCRLNISLQIGFPALIASCKD